MCIYLTVLISSALIITVECKPQCILINPNSNGGPSITILPNQFIPPSFQKEPMLPGMQNNDNTKQGPKPFESESNQHCNNQPNQWFQPQPPQNNFYNWQQANPNFNQFHNPFMQPQYPNFMPNQFIQHPNFNPQMPMGTYPCWMTSNNMPNNYPCPPEMYPNNTANKMPSSETKPTVEKITSEEIRNAKNVTVENNVIVKGNNNVNDSVVAQPEPANNEVVNQNFINSNQDGLIFNEAGTKSNNSDKIIDTKSDPISTNKVALPESSNVPEIDPSFTTIPENLPNNCNPECNTEVLLFESTPIDVNNALGKTEPAASSDISPTSAWLSESSPKATESIDSVIPVKICYCPFCTLENGVTKCHKKPKSSKKPSCQRNKCKMFVDFVPVDFKCSK